MIFGISMIILIIAAVFIYNALHRSQSEEEDTYDINIKIVNESHPTDIILYGESINFRDELIYRETKYIDEDIFNSNKENRLIIINDLDGQVDLSDAEWSIIKENTIDGTWDFYYLGTDKLEKLKNLGFYNEERLENDLCLAIANYYDNKSTFNGIWTKEQEDMFGNEDEQLGMVLVMQFVRIIKSNN